LIDVALSAILAVFPRVRDRHGGTYRLLLARDTYVIPALYVRHLTLTLGHTAAEGQGPLDPKAPAYVQRVRGGQEQDMLSPA
jgi:hypothetical protein